MGILDFLRNRRARNKETERYERELTDIIEQGPQWETLEMPDLKDPKKNEEFPEPGSFLDRLLNIPRSVVEAKMDQYLVHQDYESLKKVHDIYRGLSPNQKKVQKAYARHYNRAEVDKAHQLYEATGIKPDHASSETRAFIRNQEFKDLIIADREIVTTGKTKRYYVSFLIPDSVIAMTVLVPQKYYAAAKIGARRDLVIPFSVQEYNMLDQPVGPVIPLSSAKYGIRVHG